MKTLIIFMICKFIFIADALGKYFCNYTIFTCDSYRRCNKHALQKISRNFLTSFQKLFHIIVKKHISAKVLGNFFKISRKYQEKFLKNLLPQYVFYIDTCGFDSIQSMALICTRSICACSSKIFSILSKLTYLHQSSRSKYLLVLRIHKCVKFLKDRCCYRFVSALHKSIIHFKRKLLSLETIYVERFSV